METGKTWNRRKVLVAVAAAGLSWAGLSGRNSQAQTHNLKAAYNKFASMFQYFAAKEQKFFEAEGIKVEDAFTPPPVAIPGLLSGQFDLAFHNILDIAQINLKGSSVKILFPGAMLTDKFPYAQLVVPAGSTIKTARDLEGKKIGVALLRSAIDLDVTIWLAANGVDPKKVTFVGTGIDGVVPTIKSKQVDAAYVIEPALTVIKGQKLGEVIAVPPAAQTGGGYMSTGYIARESWIERNPELAQAIVRALDKATQWLAANPKEVPGLISRNSGIPDALAQQMVLPGTTRMVRRENIQPYLDAAAKFGFIEKTVNACGLLSKYCPQSC